MDLDPQLILTHIVGFIVTVWILKRFAWKPIIDILKERRDKIQHDFDEIKQKHVEADVLKADYEAKLKDIENVSRQKLTEAITEGQRVAAEIKEQGRGEAKEIINRAKSELERDVEKARVALKEDMVKMTISAAEKIISTKLDEREHRRLISEFIDGVEEA